MVFVKPSSRTTDTGAYSLYGTVSSPSLNYIDNNFPNLMNINGSNTLTGATTVASGGSITLASGSTFTNNGTGINASNFTNTSGALMLFQSGSTLAIDGILAYNTRAISSNYTVDSSGSDLVLLVNTGAAHTITLPAPSAGRIIEIKDATGSAQTNNITLSPHASETIDGASGNKTLAVNFGTWKLVSDGTNWFFLQLQSAIPARGFADNGGSVFNATATYQVVTTVTVTPKVTGKFRVQFTGYIINQSTANPGAGSVALSHGSGSIVPDYTWTYIMPIAVSGVNNSPNTLAGIMDYDSSLVGITFPLGTPVVFNVIVKATSTTPNIAIANNSLQLSVQEVF